jgi:hypothetical protein
VSTTWGRYAAAHCNTFVAGWAVYSLGVLGMIVLSLAGKQRTVRYTVLLRTVCTTTHCIHYTLYTVIHFTTYTIHTMHTKHTVPTKHTIHTIHTVHTKHPKHTKHTVTAQDSSSSVGGRWRTTLGRHGGGGGR